MTLFQPGREFDLEAVVDVPRAQLLTTAELQGDLRDFCLTKSTEYWKGSLSFKAFQEYYVA